MTVWGMVQAVAEQVGAANVIATSQGPCEAMRMRIAEQVTFGGGGLDRAAHRRARAEAIRAHPESRGIVLWRGKLLVQQGALVRVACDHPITQEAGPTVVYLGQAEGQDVFAFDISDWEPAEQDTQSVDLFLDPSVQVHPLFDDGSHFAELRGIMAQLSPLDAEIAATAKGILGWHETHRFCAKCGNPSASAAGGWQRDCDACHAHHFPRTDPVVIMLITYGNSVLIGRSPGWPEQHRKCHGCQPLGAASYRQRRQ